jgi:3-hydroxy acid dehydrogenase/malonic semialdehyde reductase
VVPLSLFHIQAGSNLILVARRADQLETVAEAARAAGVQQGAKIATVQLDVTDGAQVAALWSKVPQELRNVDILGEQFITLAFGSTHAGWLDF